MKRKLFILMVVLALFALAACTGNSQENQAGNINNPAGSQANDENTSEPSSGPATCTAQTLVEEDFVEADDHVTGKTEDFAATITVYSDFACEGCLTMASALAKSLELYPEDIRLVFRSFPETTSQRSVIVAKAAEAAGMQGKFWEMHDLLFGSQGEWLDMDDETFQEWIWAQVAALELNIDQFDADINGEEVSAILVKNLERAVAYNSAPPVVLVNNTPSPPYITTVGDFFLYLETLMIPYGRHIQNLEFTDCPPMTIDPEANYTAALVTDQGEVIIALYPDIAPFAVNSFIFLAENDYFDDTPIYAVIEGFVAQAGDPSGTGWGSPGYLYSTEISDEISFERPGMVAMANAAPDIVNSQFFITYSPLTFLDGKHTIFGEVIDGMDVMRSLTPRDPEQNPLLPINNMILDVIITTQ
jgi:cyclophilin family peptidyl-prolyl cis-trans isomerase/protein-disulfide isomerase